MNRRKIDVEGATPEASDLHQRMCDAQIARGSAQRRRAFVAEDLATGWITVDAKVTDGTGKGEIDEILVELDVDELLCVFVEYANQLHLLLALPFLRERRQTVAVDQMRRARIVAAASCSERGERGDDDQNRNGL